MTPQIGKQLQCAYCPISQEVKESDNDIWPGNMKILLLFHIHVGEKPFSKKSKLSLSLDQQAEFIKSVLIACPSQ